MNRLALVTSAFGEDWWKIASVSFPAMEKYAAGRSRRRFSIRDVRGNQQ